MSDLISITTAPTPTTGSRYQRACSQAKLYITSWARTHCQDQVCEGHRDCSAVALLCIGPIACKHSQCVIVLDPINLRPSLKNAFSQAMYLRSSTNVGHVGCVKSLGPTCQAESAGYPRRRSRHSQVLRVEGVPWVTSEFVQKTQGTSRWRLCLAPRGSRTRARLSWTQPKKQSCVPGLETLALKAYC